jgi:putative phage-type endonuclease
LNANFFIVRQFAGGELEQGTKEWLEWRHEGIGASEAATVMNENRFESASALFQKKWNPTILDSYQNAAMALGTKLEPEARRLYVAKTGKHVKPVCVQSFRYDWLRASLDGLAENHDAVVEIKCGASVYKKVAQSHSVPVYYYGQLQHILAVTDLDSLDFWCYWPDNPPLLLEVARDDEYIGRLLNKELEFWNRVQARKGDTLSANPRLF